MRFGESYSTSNRLLLIARHILTTGLRKCLKDGTEIFANSLLPPSILKERGKKEKKKKKKGRTENKSGQGI